MRFGLSQRDFEFITESVVLPLQNHGAKVWVFGSRARGDHQRFSDLDLYVEVNKDLSQTIDAISECLANSDLPIKVDIVESQHFADSYRPSLERDKQLW